MPWRDGLVVAYYPRTNPLSATQGRPAFILRGPGYITAVESPDLLLKALHCAAPSRLAFERLVHPERPIQPEVAAWLDGQSAGLIRPVRRTITLEDLGL